MIITPEFRHKFDEEGYLIFDGFFPDNDIDHITGLLDKHIYVPVNDASNNKDKSWEDKISFFLGFLAEKDNEIREFCRQKRLVQLTTELIGPDVRLYWNQSAYKPSEKNQEFPWHQDNGYTPVEPEQYYSFWIALTDATVENGCLWILPGSHKHGTLPHVKTELGMVGYQGKDSGISVPLKKGGLLVFSSLLLHRSGPNLSKGTRKSFLIQFIPANAIDGRTQKPFTDRIWIARSGKLAIDSSSEIK